MIVDGDRRDWDWQIDTVKLFASFGVPDLQLVAFARAAHSEHSALCASETFKIQPLKTVTKQSTSNQNKVTRVASELTHCETDRW